MIAGREGGRPQVGEHHDLRLHLPAALHEVRRGDDRVDESLARSVGRAKLARPLVGHARQGGLVAGIERRQHLRRLAGDDDGRLARRPDLAEQVAGLADGEIEDRDAGLALGIDDGLVHARRGVEHDDEIPRGRRWVGRREKAGHCQHQKRERQQPQQELQRIDQFHRELVRPLVLGQEPQGGEVADRKLVLRDEMQGDRDAHPEQAGEHGWKEETHGGRAVGGGISGTVAGGRGGSRGARSRAARRCR